jgi:hypothetical protein
MLFTPHPAIRSGGRNDPNRKANHHGPDPGIQVPGFVVGEGEEGGGGMTAYYSEALKKAMENCCSIESSGVTPDELATICKTVVELAEIRQRECKHLCVENFATECFGMLLAEYAAHKKGHWRLWDEGRKR